MSRFIRLSDFAGSWIAAAICAASALAAAADQPTVRVNEVMFDPAGKDAGLEWVELYNAGPVDVALDGWTLARGDGRTIATLPPGKLPAKGFLVVRFGRGQDDADWSDGQGTFHTGTSTEVLLNRADELGLYRRAPGAATIVDFVAYAFGVKAVNGKAHDHAVAAKMWPKNAAFSAGEFVAEGNSIGRDSIGSDHDEPIDWYGDGGVLAHGPSPGTSNESPLGFVGGAQIFGRWPLLVFGQAAADKTQAAQEMLLKVLQQIRSKHMDLLGRNGDAGMGTAAPVIQDKADGKGGQKGDIVVGNVRFRFANKLEHDGKNAGGLTHPPEQPNGEILIELSLSATDNVATGDAIGQMVEWKLKDVVIHELAHAAHFRDLHMGYWRTQGDRTEHSSGKQMEEVHQVDELLAYLTNLDLLRRLMNEFPNDRAAMEARYVIKVKVVIRDYLTTGGGHKGAVDVIKDAKGDEVEEYGGHLRDEVLEQARNLLRHKVYSFLIENKGGPLTSGQRAELNKERTQLNDITPADRQPLTPQEIERIIAAETAEYDKSHPKGVAPEPKSKPKEEVAPEEKKRLAGIRSEHRKLADSVKAMEDVVKQLEDLRERGKTDDKSVDAAKAELERRKKQLKDFEEANQKDLSALKIKRVTSLGDATQRTAATLVPVPSSTFQTLEGRQAYAVLEQFAATGDLRGAVSWGSHVSNQLETSPLPAADATAARTQSELQQVADLSALVDTAAKSLVRRTADLKQDLSKNGDTPAGLAQVFSAAPPAADLPIPATLSSQVDASTFLATVFDQFAPEIVRQATQAAAPGVQVTKGGAVMDSGVPHSSVVTVKITFEDSTPDAPANAAPQTTVVKTQPDGRFEVTVPAGKTVRDVQVGGEQLGESQSPNSPTSGLPLRLDLPPQIWESMTFAQRAERTTSGAVLLELVRHQVTGAVRVPEQVETRSPDSSSPTILEDRARSQVGQYLLERLLATDPVSGKQPEWLATSLKTLAEQTLPKALEQEAARRDALVDQWLAKTIESLAEKTPVPDSVKETMTVEANALKQREHERVDTSKARLEALLAATQPGAGGGAGLPIPNTLDANDVPSFPQRVVVITPNGASSDQLQLVVARLETSIRSASGSNRVDFSSGPVESHADPGNRVAPTTWQVFEFTLRGPNGQSVAPNSAAIQSALNDLQKASPGVAAIELAQPRIAEAPNDPHFSARGSWGQDYDDQWALRKIGLEAADPEQTKWLEQLSTGQACIVAVIGSGVDWTHPELLGQMWMNIEENPYNGVDDDGNGYVDDQFGWNFRDNVADVLDRGGHDTHVAGVIAARWNNRRGLAGVNPQARIMALKSANYLGQSTSIDIGRAVYYAVDHGARVINISYSGAQTSAFEQHAIEYAVAHDVLIVAAAGNQAADAKGRGLASARGVLTVAGVGLDGSRAPFSNWGQPVTLAAPAMDILGLRARGTDFLLYVGENQNYAGETAVVGKDRDLYRASGTSFAAPLVTGAASLLISRNPRLTARQVRNQLVMSAVDADVPGWDQNTGAGLLNVRAACDANPDHYLVARIGQVRAVRREGRVEIEVSGQAEGDTFQRREVQVAFGNAPGPKDWTTIDTNRKPQPDGVLVNIPAQRFNRRGTWSIRLMSYDNRLIVREARATLDTQ